MSETPLTRASEDAADKELAEAFLRLNPELARRVALLGLARQGEKARAEAAEAENQRLTEGLREIESILKRKRDREGTGPYRALTVALETLEGDPERHVRAFLSVSPSDGGGAK